MKFYRAIHPFLMVLAFVPFIKEWWPFYISLIPPLLLIIPYALNERALERKERMDRLLQTDPVFHEYRENA